MLSRALNFFRFEIIGKLMITLASAGSRNRSPFEKLSRFLVGKVFSVPKRADFMADPLIDADQGFDVEEIRRYRNSHTDTAQPASE